MALFRRFSKYGWKIIGLGALLPLMEDCQLPPDQWF